MHEILSNFLVMRFDVKVRSELEGEFTAIQPGISFVYAQDDKKTAYKGEIGDFYRLANI